MQIKTVSTKGNLTEPISGSRIQGGIYIGKYNGKHIIIAEEDVPKELNWHDAMEYCSNLELNGFTNWYLPPKDELNFAYENARQYMNKTWYWSSTEYSSTDSWCQNFSAGSAGFQYDSRMADAYSVRAFRAF
jgi:hypothetical protein